MTVVVAMSFGLAASWLVERTDLPGKQAVYALMTGVLLFPSIFMAMGWMFLLHPRIGVINTWLMRSFHLDAAPLSIANVAGMGWVEGLGLASLAFVITSPVLRALNGALDEAATVHGIGRWRSILHVTLPLTWPALLAAAIYIAVIAVATFEVPAVIGLGSKIFTFSTLVYIKGRTSRWACRNDGIVGAVSVLLILVSLLLSWWYFRVIRLSHRYEVVRGRAYQARLVPLGRKRWIGYARARRLFRAVDRAAAGDDDLGGGAALSSSRSPSPRFERLSLQNFHRIEWGLLWRSAGHTLDAHGGGADSSRLIFRTGDLLGGGALARPVAVPVYDYVAFLPHAVPNLIFAIAMMIVALDIVPKGVSFYGTVYILLAVYVLVRISLVTRVLNAALIQIHAELEEAAHVSGLQHFRDDGEGDDPAAGCRRSPKSVDLDCALDLSRVDDGCVPGNPGQHHSSRPGVAELEQWRWRQGGGDLAHLSYHVPAASLPSIGAFARAPNSASRRHGVVFWRIV